jgi:hypothetical protein
MARSLHSILHAKRSRKVVWVAILAAPLLVVGVRAALGAGDGRTPFRATAPAATTETTAPGEMLGPTTPPVLPGATAPTPVTPPPVVTVPGGSTPTSGTSTPGTKPSGGTPGDSDSGARPTPVKKALVRNDGGRALFTLPNARPGTTSTSCVLITYNGAKAAKIRLYGKSSGTGLQQFVTLRVTRGTLPKGAAARSCTGFKADATNYRGLGSGVVYNGVLATFPTKWATAYPVSQRWKTGAKHAYRFEALVADTNAAQGLWMNASFTWEARAG